MSTQQSNKAIFTNIKAPVFRLDLMDKTEQPKAQQPVSIMGHYFKPPTSSGKAQQKQQQQGNWIINYVSQVRRR